MLGANLTYLEKLEETYGFQVYILSAMEGLVTSKQLYAQIELILMPVDAAASSYNTFYSVEYVDMSAEVSGKNTGTLNLGGANDYLLFTTQTFDTIYGL